MYSFALVVWEIYAVRRPFPRGWTLLELLQHVGLNGQRPEMSDEVRTQTSKTQCRPVNSDSCVLLRHAVQSYCDTQH